MQMIDKITGNITLTSEIAIKPGMTESEFRSLPFSMERDVHRYQVNGRKHRDANYWLTTIDEDSNRFTLLASYRKSPGSVSSRLFSVLLTRHFPETTTDGYEALAEREAWHKEWMRRKFGTSRKITAAWGSIQSLVEIKEATASIIVVYK